MKKLLVAMLAAAGLAAFAADPNSEETAIQLKPTTSQQHVAVKLYPEGTNEMQVCYYKMTLSKGKAYTIWVGDKSARDAAIDIDDAYPKISTSETQEEPMASFEMVEFGEEQRWVVDGKTWGYDDDDGWDDDFGDDEGDLGDFGDDDFDIDWVDPVIPDSWTYYIVIRGKAGETCNLYYIQKNDVPVGVAQNPLVISPDTKDVTKGGLEFKSSDYFVQMKVVAGRRYYLMTSGGASTNLHAFVGLTDGVLTNIVPWTVGAYDQGVCYIPDASGTKVFSVSSGLGYSSKMGLKFRVDPARAIASHSAKTLTVGKETTCWPGWMNKPNSGFYDNIIDEELFSFSAAKGKRYVVDTEGAATNLILRLYDKDGNVLATNVSKGKGSLDVRAAFEATAKATYYVGVCEDLPLFDDTVTPTYAPVTLTLREVAIDESASTVNPIPGDAAQRPEAVDTVGCGPNTLDATRWYNTYSFIGRGPVSNEEAGVTYAFSTTTVNPSEPVVNGMTALVYWMSGKTKKVVATGDITPGEVFSFSADANRTYYLRIYPTDGEGLDCPDYRLHAMAFCEYQAVGSLKVTPKGAAAATWQLGKTVKGKLSYESAKYAVGDSLILPEGQYTVKYLTVKGYSKPSPETKTVSVVAGKVVELIDTYYSDKYDSKDDNTAKVGKTTYAATSWSLKNAPTTTTGRGHTLWKNDPADYYAITPKDGYLYDFALEASEGGDAVFSILDANLKPLDGASKVKGVSQIAMPASASKKYFVKVEHANDAARVDGTYDINGFFANVGAIKFSKTSVTAKDTATSVKLTVNRSASDGELKVRYRTVDGSAKAGEHYVAQEDVLTWSNKDKKAKTIEIKLIPKLGAWYAGGDKTFTVELEDAHGEYPAPITTPTATVTIKESSKASVTQQSVYDKKAAKTAKVTTEKTPLRGGTYFGVVSAADGALTNGFPQAASVTLTVSAKDAASTAKDTISAKVALAGKTYTFKPAKNESAWDGTNEVGQLFKTLKLVQKVNKVEYENTLELTLSDGAVATDWASSKCGVKLLMNVPDANAKGVQANVAYQGEIFRQNAKVQDYLNAVVKFAGYYTMALKPVAETLRPGVPSGNGYLTVTVDNKGKAKVAGLLADNTKVSASATACAIVKNDESPVGWDMYVPVFQAKSPYCFAALLKLTAKPIAGTKPDGKSVNPDGTSYDIVIATDSQVMWNNDNAKLTYKGDGGWQIDIVPVGGWYDKVFTLQNYYKDYALKVDTASISEFPKEVITTAGYRFVTDVEPDRFDVDLAANALTTPKKSLVKDGKAYDLAASVNPCNVQVKLARATGIVTGSCSVWSENADGSAMKEITGFKHYGILLLERDASSEALGTGVLTAGFLNKSVKVGGRNTVFSVPFNIADQTK